ncbi:uncharacterized protein PHACADRAFT_97642, partial [Phanerochaete carnosa HHB-10118-sp]
GGSRCVAGQTSNSCTSYYCHYRTVMQTNSLSDASVTAQLRVYSSRDDTPLSDDTVVFTVACSYFPLNKPVLLEAIHVYLYSSNPMQDGYDEFLPNIPTYVMGLGIIRLIRDITALNNNKHTMLEVTEHVCDEKKTSTFE